MKTITSKFFECLRHHYRFYLKLWTDKIMRMNFQFGEKFLKICSSKMIK